MRELARLVRLAEGDLAGATRGVGLIALALLGVYALRSLGQHLNFHDELLARLGAYARLYAVQFGRAA